MIDKVEIATRHGLAPEIGSLLHGTTRDELEADAAARAAVAQLVGGKLNPPPEPSGGDQHHARPLADLTTAELTEQREQIVGELERRESTESSTVESDDVAASSGDPLIDALIGRPEEAP